MSDASDDIFAAERAALLVIDMQNDYCLREGIIGCMGFDVSGSPALAERLTAFVDAARPLVALTIFVRTTVPPWARSPALAAQYGRGPLRREVLPHLSDWYRVTPVETDVIIEKHRYSAFVGTGLETILRSNGIGTIIVAGVTTEVCVESTVRDAFMRDLNVVVVADCTQASTEDRKSHSLSLIDTFFGRVHTAAEILDRLARGAGRASDGVTARPT